MSFFVLSSSVLSDKLSDSAFCLWREREREGGRRDIKYYNEQLSSLTIHATFLLTSFAGFLSELSALASALYSSSLQRID